MKLSFVMLPTLSWLEWECIQGFSPLLPFSTKQSSSPSSLVKSSSADEQVDELEIQWDLFRKHHAKQTGDDGTTSWKGIWTTYDYIGDVMDETVASVNYVSANDQVVQQTHSIVAGAKRSDCATCFDSMEVKEFPVTQYRREVGFQKTRLGSHAMVNGPSLLKSGVMATELILAYGDGRVRVTFQHAPVWANGIEPGSGPPQGLKLVRTMVSRETTRDTAPTAETEAANPPSEGNPIFYRPVPPFNWHKKWAGTSWTWGPTTGDRGWAIEQLEEEDAWQGISTVERWNLRLPGGIFMQAPRVITDMQAELCRLAWLPTDEVLLRVEAGCLALQPMVVEDDQLVGFYPPSLASLRCDVLQKIGELDQVPSFVKSSNAEDELVKPVSEETAATTSSSMEETTATIPQQSSDASNDNNPQPKAKESTKPKTEKNDDGNSDSDSGLQAIRDALSL